MQNNFYYNLKAQYSRIKQSKLDKPIIQPGDIYPLIERIKNNSQFQVAQVGRSFLDKPIYKIQVGQGPIKLLMWSQMHGNEPTATGSLFDLINYISAPENKAWFEGWRKKLTLVMVPMVNPDGAQLKQRFNAQSIDINRDAKRLQTPEGKLLAALADEIKPNFGFNLHDQNRYHAVGTSSNTATISMLAPAFNDAKDISPNRHKAMQMIGLLSESIQQQYPNHVGRYDDTYSFRAFGDLFSSKDITTILIESGHYPNDQNRQVARWLTFLSLVNSINMITDETYAKESLQKHDAIPMNRARGLVDILLTNVNVEPNYKIDISINFDAYFEIAVVREIGDLSANFGLYSRDMGQYQFQTMRGFELKTILVLTTPIYLDLLQQGYGYFMGDPSLLNIKTDLPIVINPNKEIPKIPQRLNQANFLFTQNGKVKLALINGTFIDIN